MAHINSIRKSNRAAFSHDPAGERPDMLEKKLNEPDKLLSVAEGGKYEGL